MKTSTKLTVREKIVRFLQRNARKDFTAKGIARAAKLNYNTVRKELGFLTSLPLGQWDSERKVVYGNTTKNGYYTYRSYAA